MWIKSVARWLLYIIIIIILTVLAIDYYVAKSGEKYIYKKVNTVPNRNVALLLGTAKYIRRGKINYFYRYRIEAAAALYRAGKVKAILVSGDNATPYYNEPLRMWSDLIKAGVPKKSIYLDYAGFRTLDSVMRAQAIFGLKRYIIVSQKFHLERALFIARATGADAIGFAAKDLPGTKAAWRMRFREYLARVKAFLDLYLTHTTPKFYGPYEKIPIKENLK